MTDSSVFTDKTAAYYTLGCKLNFAETSTIGRALLERGVRTARAGEQADVCVINTCSVTEQADRKCRAMIRRARREHPRAQVIVTGCYAQLQSEEVAALEGVNLVIGAESKLDSSLYLEQLSLGASDATRIVRSDEREIRSFGHSASTTERTRYFLKVQDGCDYQCTYCTIPQARGRSRSATVTELRHEAERLVELGAREIVLTGVNIGDFGRGRSETFLDLIRSLDEVAGLDRLRISSIEPNLLKEEVIDFVATSQRIAPHFHLPLQSGSDEVLRLMRRRYDTTLFASRVAYIRERLPQAFIAADVIVGMRGESPALYEASYNYIKDLALSQLHVFTYSERAGTAALRIAHSVPARERHQRSQRLARLSAEKLSDFYCSQLGRPVRVLWEQGQRDGLMFGHSENYLRIAQPYRAELVGQLTEVTPRALSEAGDYLI